MQVRGVSRVTIRVLIVLTFMCGGLIGAPGTNSAVAQGEGLVDDTTYVLETTGDEITWDDPWAFDPDVSEVGDGYEIVALSGDLSSLLISVLPNGLDIEDARDLVLDEFQAGTDAFATVDRGAYDNISYSLDAARIDGADLGVFTLFRGGSGNTPTFAYIVIGMVQGFSEDFRSAQEEITVDGDLIFDGVDGEDLERQLGNSGGNAAEQSDDSNADDVTDDPLTPESGSSEAIFNVERDAPELDEDAVREDRSTSTEDEIEEEFGDLGVVSQGEYVSPQFGSELVWDDTWLLYEDTEEPVVSDEEEGTDSITLVWNDDGIALIRVELVGAQGATPGDVVGYWTSDDFLGTSTNVVLEDSGRDRGGVVTLDATEDGTEVLIYREVHLLDNGDTLGLITFLSEPPDAEDALLDAQDGIELDEESVLDYFDTEEVVEILE